LKNKDLVDCLSSTVQVHVAFAHEHLIAQPTEPITGEHVIRPGESPVF
jgi:hypothetical protein